PVGMVPGEPAQPVPLGVDLLAVVEDVGEVVHRLGEGGGQPQLHRDAALHVGGAAPVEPVVLAPGGDVVHDRHGVDVPGQHDALGPAQAGPGDHGVTVPVHPQVAQPGQGAFDHVGQGALPAADRLGVDESRGEGADVCCEV